MWGWLAKPFVPYLVGAVGMAGVALWFNTQYVPSSEHQALAADLQRTQLERNTVELKLKRQAQEYAEKAKQNREDLQKTVAENRRLYQHIDTWRAHWAEIDHDDEVKRVLATPVPDAIVDWLRGLATYGASAE